MRLLTITDPHGDLPELDYDELAYDAVLINGDLGFNPEQRDAIRSASGGAGEAIVQEVVADVHAYLDRIVDHEVPVYTVPGNWDLAFYDTLIQDDAIHDLEATADRVDGVRLAGYGAHETPTRPELPLRPEDMDRYPDRQKRENRYWERYSHLEEQLDGEEPSVVLAHNSPYGTDLDRMHDGRHIGSVVLRDIIDEEQPDYVVSGHVHEAAGCEAMGDTTVINGGERGAAIIDLDADTVDVLTGE